MCNAPKSADPPTARRVTWLATLDAIEATRARARNVQTDVHVSRGSNLDIRCDSRSR